MEAVEVVEVEIETEVEETGKAGAVTDLEVEDSLLMLRPQAVIVADHTASLRPVLVHHVRPESRRNSGRVEGQQGSRRMNITEQP